MQLGALLEERRKDLFESGHSLRGLPRWKPRRLVQNLERLAVPGDGFPKFSVLLLLLRLDLTLCVGPIRDVLDDGGRTGLRDLVFRAVEGRSRPTNTPVSFWTSASVWADFSASVVFTISFLSETRRAAASPTTPRKLAAVC